MTWFKKSVNGLWCASHVRTEDFMSSIWLLMRLKPSDFYPSTLRTPRWQLTLTFTPNLLTLTLLTLLTQTLLTLLTLILSLTPTRDSPSFFHVLLGCTTTVAPQSVFRLNQWIGSCKCYGNVAHLQTIRALLCDLEPPCVDYLGSFLERDWYDSYSATVGFVLSLVSKDRSCVNESFTTEKLIDFVFQVFFFSELVVLWNWHYQQMVRDVNIWRFQQLKLFQAQWHLQKKCVLFLYFLLLRSNEWPKLKHPLLHFIVWPISNLT